MGTIDRRHTKREEREMTIYEIAIALAFFYTGTYFVAAVRDGIQIIKAESK